jgi:hypothetical protein
MKIGIVLCFGEFKEFSWNDIYSAIGKFNLHQTLCLCFVKFEDSLVFAQKLALWIFKKLNGNFLQQKKFRKIQRK